jgi:phosphoserine phosphatase
VATDADNTLWAGDVGDEVVRAAATPPFYPWTEGQADLPGYLSQMESDYAAACRYAAAVLALVPAEASGPVLESALARRVTPRPWLLQALRAAVDRGVRVWIVSASPRQAVVIGARQHGLADVPILAVDCLSSAPPTYREPVPIGQGKVAALARAGLLQPDLALGDSMWDLPMLRSARQGVMLARACDDPSCPKPEEP